MKVIVTGGTGFIGKHLVRTILRSEEHKLVIIDNLSNSSIQRFYEFLSGFDDRALLIKGDRLTVRQLDIRNEDDLRKVFKQEGEIDVCIHLAAKVSVIDSVRDPNLTFATNVKGTQNVLSCASQAGIRNFVFASSAAVYGKPKHLPADEEDLTEPISPYGKSKLLGEQLVERYSEKFDIVRSLRIFNVYGEGQTMDYAGVITRFAHRIASKKPPIIYGDGNQTRDFISIDDVARSIMLAGQITYQKGSSRENNSLDLEEDRHKSLGIINGNFFNIGTGIPTTVSGLAALMIELMTRQHRSRPILQPIYGGALEGEVRNSFADTRRSYKYLGFRFRDDLRAGLTRMLSGNE